MTLLSLYTACAIFQLICLVALIIWLVFKKRGQSILCTECQSCITRCPMRKRKHNAFNIMLWSKTGSEEDELYKELNGVCIRCKLCCKDCPRGIAPFELLPGRQDS